MGNIVGYYLRCKVHYEIISNRNDYNLPGKLGNKNNQMNKGK